MSEEIDWPDFEERLPELQHYGKEVKKRCLSEKSSLHECQKEALQSIVDWFSDEDTENITAVVVMPTGTGKTGVICCLPYVIGGAIANGEIPSDKINIRKPILVIAPGLDILHQLEDNLLPSNDCFLRKRGLLRKKDMSEHYYNIVRVTNTSQLSKTGESFQCYDIVLSNAQKWRKVKDGTPNYEDLPDDLFSMVIVDEAHHLPAKQWEDIVKKFREYAKIVFFTATPERADKKEITTDGAISTNGYAYELTREEAIKLRLIREVKPFYLKTQPNITIDDLTQAAKKIKLVKSFMSFIERMKYAEQVLVQIKARIEQKNRECPLPGNTKHSAIIITKNINDANEVEHLCIGHGFSRDQVLVMHTKKIKGNKRMREDMIKKIQDGRCEVVIIVKMLLEGFDYPPFSIAGILTRIHSPVKFAQFVGRIQRLVRQPTVEGNVEGDIITHEYFKQKDLFEEYIRPRIELEKENESIDEDYEEMNGAIKDEDEDEDEDSN